ncbi:hypothetical protein [Natronorubrum tibetense]|uniref:Uncharacterized protein n=1 Tax=Natronorubrum tibetense GA33 TaxID=1114856 RepID=L9WBY1_9EURY|nr:hypothetical protein [Natronorubrum tibetense]ELY46867.1 hypothetical protein C496_00360 [Natronorubrum tibetense GA33]
MLESVPPLVETAIYGYFLLVAAIGCYLHGRLWISARSRNRDELADETPGIES